MATSRSGQELQSMLTSTEKLAYQGRESVDRLVCLNRLAHLAALEYIKCITDDEDMAFAEEQVRQMDCFTLNRRCLNCLEILTGENVRLSFEKIKQRLVVDIRFFLERENVSPIRQKMLQEKLP